MERMGTLGSAVLLGSGMKRKEEEGDMRREQKGPLCLRIDEGKESSKGG